MKVELYREFQEETKSILNEKDKGKFQKCGALKCHYVFQIQSR
jgi:hypothetical protein